MGTDLELLERAAKAVGLPFRIGEQFHHMVQPQVCIDGDWQWWNPLIDDGAALRLAVKLGISVDVLNPEKPVTPHSEADDARREGCVVATIRGFGYRHKAPHLVGWSCMVRWVSMSEFNRVQSCMDRDLLKFWRDNCPQKFENAYTATRRAIVRAAAAMPEGGQGC